MDINYYDDKIPCGSVYAPSGSAFYTPNGSWATCRDVFAGVMPSHQVLYFSHPANCGKNVANFFLEVENKLKLEEFSLFSSTQSTSVTHVRPSNWWMRCPIRRSLFTALIRVASNFNGNNFDTIVHSLHSGTYVAFLYFLEGNTYFQGNLGIPFNAHQGWYYHFGHAKLDKVKNLLDKEPKDKKKSLTDKLKKLVKKI